MKLSLFVTSLILFLANLGFAIGDIELNHVSILTLINFVAAAFMGVVFAKAAKDYFGDRLT